CLRKPYGISRLFSIAYAFTGNGCIFLAPNLLRVSPRRLAIPCHCTRYKENGQEGKISLWMPRRKSPTFRLPILTLQRHFNVLPKFAHVESRFCGRKGRGKSAFDVPINPCVRSICSQSVAVGLIRFQVAADIPEVPRVVRLVRSLVLSLREQPYAEAADA